MYQKLKKIFSYCLDQCMPPICLLCGNLSLNSSNLCAYCKKHIPWLKKTCYQCGIPLSIDDTTIALRCGECLQSPPSFERTYVCVHYQKPIDRLIQQLKFQKNLSYAQLIGDIMAEKFVVAERPHCLIPVPLHPSRLRERGFNQAIEIARPLSKKLQIPLCLDAFVRIKDTRAQSALNTRERNQNIKQAFACKKTMTYKHVAIVDDVMTTGNTLRALADTIKKSGVEKISLWVFARTVLCAR